MNRWQWFVSSLIIMTGSIFFLTLFTYSGVLYYSIAFEEDTYEPETRISNLNLGNLTREEAEAKLENEAAKWQTDNAIVFRWFDKNEHVPAETLDFRISDSLETLTSAAGEDQENSLTVLADEQHIVEVLELFGFYDEVENRIYVEGLLNDIESEAAVLPDGDMVINVHDYIFDDQADSNESIYTASRDYESSLLEAWVRDLPSVAIEAESTFSLLDAMEEARVESLSSKPLSVLGSAVYEVLLHSNFELIERVQNDSIEESIALGFDVKMAVDSYDLVFHNPNPVTYNLEFDYVENQLNVTLAGEEFPYLIEVNVENQKEINPKTIIQYSDSLGAGAVEVVQNGSEGTNFDLLRTVTAPLGEENETQEIASDYYPPVHRIELRSSDDYIAHEEEPEGETENGFDEDVENGWDPSDETPPPDDGDWDEESWENGEWDGINGENGADPGGFQDDFDRESENGSPDAPEDEESGAGQDDSPGDDGDSSHDWTDPDFNFPSHDEDGNEIKGH